MGEVRAFAEEHVIAVANLHLRVMGQHAVKASPEFLEYFRDIFFRNPWRTSDISPLVYIDAGRVVGFLGVIPRIMDFGGRSIRAATVSQFVVDRQLHRGPAAILLLRRFFQGPQDLSYTDGAAEESHRIWAAVGGHGSHLYSFHWLRSLLPVRTARGFIDRAAAGPVRFFGKLLLAGASPLDSLLMKVPGPFRVPDSSYIAAPVDAEGLLQAIQQIGWRELLKPLYDPSSFPWLMAQAARSRRQDELRMSTVRSADGELCGWYVGYFRPGQAATLLQLGSRRRDQFDQVFATMLREAAQSGVSAVKGKSMPSSVVTLTSHNCIFRQANTCVLFHSRDPKISGAIFQGKAALSGLDGEEWLNFFAPNRTVPA